MNKFLNCGAAALLILVAPPVQSATERSYFDLRLLGTSGGGNIGERTNLEASSQALFDGALAVAAPA